MNCCKPQPMGTEGYGKMLKRIHVLEMAGSQQRSQETGGMKDKREDSQEKGITSL